MKKIVRKILIFTVLTTTFCIGSQPTQAMQTDQILSERRQANIIDATIFTIAAKVVNDYVLENPDKLSLLTSVGYGVGSWLCDELSETIYKEVYKKLAHKSLRETLGTTTICGIEIDNQRLLRRVMTLGTLCIALYLKKHD